MAVTRKEIINGVEITIVEDSRGDGIHDFLSESQEMNQLSGKDKEERLKQAFGSKEGGKPEPLSPEEQEALDQRHEQIYERSNSSRACSDVAMAMMLADQASSAAAITPCYVVHGAKMICSFGSREARLVVPMDHGVCLTKAPQMLDEDYVALENVKCFGNCFSPDHPNMEQAAIEATNLYNQEQSQTFFGKVKGFFGIKPKEVTSVSKELKAACICECTPAFTNHWSDGNKKSQADGRNTLIQTCNLVCQYGGIVKIIDNGQEQ